MNYSNPDSMRNACQWLIVFMGDNTLITMWSYPGFDAPVDKLLEPARTFLGIWKRFTHITGE